MKEETPAQLQRYLRTFLKRPALTVAPLLVGIVIAALVAMLLPKTYEARSLVRVQYPQVSNISFREIQETIAERLKTIQEEVKSFGQLLTVVQELGLDAPLHPLPESEREQALEDLILDLQKNLAIKTKGARESIDIIEIALRGRDPARVRDIVNALTQQYINRNMAQKLDRLSTTVSFLEAKVREYEKRLNTSSEALQGFRQAHLEDLTGVDTRSPMEESYLARLNSLKAQLQSVDYQIDAQEGAQKVLLDKLSAERAEVIRTILSSLEPRQRELELELQTLLTLYTENHPEVKRVRAELNQVKLLREQGPEEGGEATYTESALVAASPIYADIRRQLLDVEKNLLGLTSSRDVLVSQVEEERQRVSRVPELLAEMKRLTEEDASNRTILERYTTELAHARFQLDVEKELKGISFEILETARMPRWPVTPRRTMILFMGIALGGLLGIGLALYAEALDTSFHTVEEAGQFLSMPVIGTIPAILTPREARRLRQRAVLQWAFLAGSVTVVILFAAAVLFGLTGG